MPAVILIISTFVFTAQRCISASVYSRSVAKAVKASE